MRFFRNLYEVCDFDKQTSRYIPTINSFVLLPGYDCKIVDLKQNTVCYDDILTRADHGTIYSKYIPILKYDNNKTTMEVIMDLINVDKAFEDFHLDFSKLADTSNCS